MVTPQKFVTRPKNLKSGFQYIGLIKPARFVAIFILSVVYLITRIFNLMLLPPFVDEMVYSHWADQMQQMNPLDVVTSGHGPLFPLIELFIGKLFAINLILAGRVLSLVAGLITLLLLYKIGIKLWGIVAAICTGILYIFSPFILTYNRMGLMEGPQALFMLGALYLALILATAKNTKRHLIFLSLGLGVVLGGAMLVKLNSLIALVWIVLAVALNGGIRFRGEFSWKLWKFVQIDWLKWLALLLSCLIGIAFFSIQLAAPLYFGDNFDNFQFPLKDVIFSPGTTWWPRLLPYIGSTIGPYLTWPVLLIVGIATGLSIVGLFLFHNKNLQQNSLKAFTLLVAGMIALAPTLFLLKLNAPRYLFSGFILFYPVAGWFITEVGKVIFKKIQPGFSGFSLLPLFDIALSCLVSLAALPFMLNLITNPDAAAFPPQDDVQFLSGWPSGNELAGFSSVIRQVSSETYPNTVQIVNIDANPGANNYKMMLYLSLNPSQDGVRTPPNLQYKAIPFSSDMPYFNQWLFHYSQVRSDQVTLVEMQASDEQRLNWSKNNPEFQLVAQYNKPAKFAYWLYKYNPPASINNPETANLSGQGDLVAQLRLSQPGPKPNQFGTQLKIQNVGNGKAVNITVSIPTGPDYKLSFIDFGDKAKITGQTDQVTQLAVTSLGPNESINGSLIFEGSPKSPNTPSDIRYSLNWVDGKGPGQFTMSNSIALTTSGEISSQPAASPANGSTQPLKATTPAGQSEGLMEFEGNFYIPGEIVTYWITDKAGKSTELGKTTADSKGSINLKLDAKTFSPGSYTLAAYGNRSEVTGSLLIRF